MYINLSVRGEKRIVAACDSELLGQVFEEGGAILDLERHKSFYMGEKADAGKLGNALGKFDSANLVGKKAVGVALERGIAEKEDVKYIKKVPHLQIYRI
ncbi:DUF424 family protein [Candidatus Micrarchaeota archaeon]|nr:DUF424 family protein [Candidatus Micrarchaeota archaeon]MBD3417792.1 DUF424 family protein [Candidatus Micrarchaeota archaeon]